MNKWVVTTCVVGGIALAAVAWAGGPEGRGGQQKQGGPDHALRALEHNPTLAKELGVTDEQIASLRAASYEHEKNTIKLRSDVQLARLEVKKLLEADTVDKDAVMAAVDNAGKVTVDLRKAQIGFMIQIKEVLGKDTLQKLREKGRERFREGRDRQGQGQGSGQGRGGPGRDGQGPGSDNQRGPEGRGPGFGFSDDEGGPGGAPWMQDEMMPPDDMDDSSTI